MGSRPTTAWFRPRGGGLIRSDRAERNAASFRPQKAVGLWRFMAGPSQAISNAVVSLFRERFGRGPTKARTHINDGLVTCVLHEVMTTEDRSLVDAGGADLVETKRSLIREDARERLEQAVEKHVGEKVVAVLSDMDPAEDVAVINFLLDTARRAEP